MERAGMLRFLSLQGVSEIHESTLQVLRTIGLTTNSNLIFDTFKKAGFPVDSSEKKIRFPGSMVESALKTVPSSVTLFGRDPEKDLRVDAAAHYYGLGGSATPKFRETGSGRIRIPTKTDVIAATVLGDSLQNIDFVMSLAGAYDCPPEMHYLHEYEALLCNTGKPIIYSAPGRRYASQFLRMASAVVGGEEALKKRPIITLFAETLSPLCLPEYMEGIFEFAAMNAPVLISPSPIMGATSPVTLGGNVVIGNAETLAGVCLSQILKPGTPVIYGPHTPVMDMRTTKSTYAATEQAVARAAVSQMAQYYGIPSFGTGGGTDAKYPDAQAGAEVGMNIFMNAFSGLNLTQGIGTMASGSYGSLEMAFICNEIIGMAKRAAGGIALGEGNLAVETIKDVGPGGHFLDHPHTLEFFRRELYQPVFFDRQPDDLWAQAGEKRIDEVASERVLEILTDHNPTNVADSVKEELSKIIRRAEKDLSANNA